MRRHFILLSLTKVGYTEFIKTIIAANARTNSAKNVLSELSASQSFNKGRKQGTCPSFSGTGGSVLLPCASRVCPGPGWPGFC